jgi:hypothetical protein
MTNKPQLLVRLVLYLATFCPGFLSLGIPLCLSAIAPIGLGLFASLITSTWATEAEHKEPIAKKRHDAISRATGIG